MKLLIFAGSLRRELAAIKDLRGRRRVSWLRWEQEGWFLDLKDYPMPPYDGDIETSHRPAEATNALGQRYVAADAFDSFHAGI